MANVQEEIWKDIEGFEGRYQISNIGRVRSLVKANPHNGIGFSLRKEPLIRRPHDNADGYLHVRLLAGKKDKSISIHRLVAKAFIPNPKNLPEVNHLNGKLDNCVESLEWTTSRDNQLHAYRTGLRKRMKHEENPKAILTVKQVMEIFSSPLTHRQLSIKYGVSLSGINNVKNGYAWTEITGKKPTAKCID